jgi:hypothetical protein
MIPLKTNKISLLFFNLSLLVLLISCSTTKNKLSENNYFNKNYFYNDNLKVGIDFDKNIEFKEVSVVKEKEIKELLKGHNTLSPKDLFLVADAKEKDMQLCFFYQNVKKTTDSLANVKTISNDPVNNTVLFEKQKGSRKISGLFKSNSNGNNDATVLLANALMNKISIDSLNTRKLSFVSVFINYFPGIHPNGLNASKKLKTLPLKSEGEESDKFQFLSTVNSLMSNNKTYDSLIVGYEKERKEKYTSLITDLSNKNDVYTDNSVFIKLSEVAKENQIIMLNEDHYYPKHRLFAMELLETLKSNGYQYISMEGFNDSTENWMTPNYRNGIYTDEPYFAHFIRKAIALGFTISGHENFEKGIDRELGQAKNIIKILEKDPNAKIFIYVGHGHLEKKSNDGKRMAEYFKDLSGINPVTINQVLVCADTKQELTLIPRVYLNDTTMVKSSADYFLVNNLKPSLKVIYPKAIFKKAIIKSESFSDYKNKEVLVEVIDSKEYDSLKNLAIPLESFLSIPRGKEINYELPVGKYHIYVKTEDDKILYDNDIQVD